MDFLFNSVVDVPGKGKRTFALENATFAPTIAPPNVTFAPHDRSLHRSLHLITPNNKLVNAALILFAKDPQAWFPTATVKCAQFYGFRTEKPIPSLQIY